MLKMQIIRFVIVGIVNTLNYYILYLFFIHLIGLAYLIAHMLAFIVSMVGSFYMNTLFTYKTRPTLRKFFQFPLTYIVNITVTTVSIYILVDLFHFDENTSPLVASVIAIPFTFLISKRILLKNSTNTKPQ